MGFPAMNSPCRIKTIRKIESCLRPFFQVTCTIVGVRYRLLLLAVGPGVDSASNRNEYQEDFLGVNAAGAYG